MNEDPPAAFGDDPEGWRLMRQQGELRENARAVAEYGEAHPDDRAYLQYVNDHPVRIAAAFAKILDAHVVALRPLRQHPERVEFRIHPWSAEELERVRAELHQRLFTDKTRPPARSLELGPGIVQLRLAPDQERLAAELHERYGEIL